MKKAPLVFFLLVSFCTHANTTDSLENALKTARGIQRAIVLNELAMIYQPTDLQQMERIITQTKLLFSSSNDPLIKVYCFLTLGLYHNHIGSLDSSVYSFNEAKRLAAELKDVPLQIRTNTNLGHALITHGKAQAALENLFEVLAMLKTHPDKKDTEWRVRTNIAWAYLELKRYQDCIRFGNESLKLMQAKELQWIAPYTYNNVAVAYGALKQYDSARALITKSIQITEANGNIHILANAYFILGKIYAETGQHSAALQQYLKAKPLREKVGNPSFIISDLYAIADLYYEMGDYTHGIENALEALKVATQFDLLLKFDGTYLSLAKNYEGLGDFKNASKYYHLWALAKDSVYSQSHADAIAEMQTKYETEKKEQQLALQEATLTEQRVELQRTYFVLGALTIILLLLIIISLLLRSRYKRKQQLAEKQRELAVREAYINATIDSQENERKRVARDLHDGMGQLISALRITMEQLSPVSSFDERLLTTEKCEKIMNDMHREVRGVAFNLMPQTLIQHGLVPALQEMALRINENAPLRIEVTSFDMEARLQELQEISVYRIVQEWTTNVTKYAKATKIIVDLVADEGEIRITIEDDGHGFDSTTLQLGSGNGWKNIQSRLGLLKGAITLDSTAGRQGTTLFIQFPKSLVQSQKHVV
jgi:signal transduction histidine kinase